MKDSDIIFFPKLHSPTTKITTHTDSSIVYTKIQIYIHTHTHIFERMELNLEPQMADQTLFEGEGGAYYSWSTANSPLLSEAKIGAGKLVLQPCGFALPHYADSPKIGYVLQGQLN